MEPNQNRSVHAYCRVIVLLLAISMLIFMLVFAAGVYHPDVRSALLTLVPKDPAAMRKSALLELFYSRGDALFAKHAGLVVRIACPIQTNSGDSAPTGQRSHNGGGGFLFFGDNAANDKFFYVITARHLVRSCDKKQNFQIGILNFSVPFTVLSATLLAEHPEKDFAILRVKKPEKATEVPAESGGKIVRLRAAKMAKNAPVEYDIVWGFSRFHYRLGYIEAMYNDRRYFSINGFSVEFGDSGMPVFNDREEIIGIIVGLRHPFLGNSGRGIALHITKEEVRVLLKKPPR